MFHNILQFCSDFSEIGLKYIILFNILEGQTKSTILKLSSFFSLVELLSLRSDLYLKLVISCLDYTSPDWGSRNLLSKALKEGSELCKLYATRFLGVLIRSRTPNIAQWGIELLVKLLFHLF